MTATTTINWTTKNGKEIEVKIELTREVADNIAYADGDNVNLGKKTTEILNIEVYADGKFQTRSFESPKALTPKFYRNYNQLVAAGAYARLGDAYINQEQYNMIMATLEKLNTEATPDAEFEAIKTQETAEEVAQEEANKAEAERYAAQMRNGLCLKCGTYCYGDCEANK